jgi:hypothetical protein
LTLEAIESIINEAVRKLKAKKKLEALKKQIQIAYFREVSRRRKKKADLELRKAIEEAIALEVEYQARKRREEEDMIAILYILAEIE